MFRCSSTTCLCQKRDCYCSRGKFCLTFSSPSQGLSRDTVQDKAITDFFTGLKDDHCFKEAPSGLRFDFLACAGLQQGEAVLLAQDLETKIGVSGNWGRW